MDKMMDKLWLNSQERQEIQTRLVGENPTYYTMGTGVKAAG
jgi:hypothetical protein